jgi:C4-dicarboxylate-specific signal transduction histidine kinase
LAIISGHVAMLDYVKQSPEKFHEKVETIQRSVERISKIINGLRKFSRSTDKKAYKANLLEPIVREALVLVEAKAKKFSVRLDLKFASEFTVLCDDIEIEQVLVNLINNSIDAINKSADPWIEISTFDDQNEVVLRVMDSGAGIQANVVARIFEPFYTTKPVGEGTGLGLSIVKGILDEHKASIRVLTELKNTCFEIRFRKLVVSNVA